MTAYQAGTAYVEIMPSLRGFHRSVEGQLAGATAGVGAAAGRSIGARIGEGAAAGMTPGLGRAQRSVGAMVTATARLSPTLGRVRDGFTSAGAAASGFSGKAGTVGGTLRRAAARVDTATAAFGRFRSKMAETSVASERVARQNATLGRVASSVGFTAVAAFGGMAAAALYAGANMEHARKTLTGLYGSAAEATSMMQRLKKVSSQSPISYSAFTQAAQQLAYMGYKGEDAIGILKNVAAAVVAVGGGSEAMGRVSAGMLKMVNAGKVSLDALNQISEAGVPIYSALAAHFHKSIAQVREMVTAGKVGIDDVMDTIRKAQGKNFQQMKAAAKSSAQSLSSQFQIAADRVLVSIGTMTQPLVAKLAPAVGVVGQKIQSAIDKIPSWFASVKAAMDRSGVTAAFGRIGEAIAALWGAAKPFLSGFVNGLAAGFGAVVLVLGKLAPLVTAIANFMGSHSGLVHAFGMAIGFVAAAMISFKVAALAAKVAGLAWRTVMAGGSLMALLRGVGQAIIGMTVALRGQTIATTASKAATIGYYIGLGVAKVAQLGYTAVMWAARGAQMAFAGALTISTVAQRGFAAVLYVVRGAQIAFNAVMIAARAIMLTNPVVLIITAIAAAAAALVVGLYYLIKNWRSVWAGIKVVAMWVWHRVLQPIFNGIMAALRAAGRVAMWFYHSAIQPAFNAVGRVISWVVNHAVKPVLNFFKGLIHSVGQRFSDVVDWIGRAWSKVKKIALAPVKFVVDVVYNHGILPVWNFVAGIFGLGKLKPVHMARGGILPGYTPGRDTMVATSPAGPVALGGGEAVMRPEWTRAAGPGYIEGANRASRHGGVPGAQRFIANNGLPGQDMPGFFLGGVFDWVGDAFNAVKSGVSTAFGWVKNVVGDVAEFMSDPIGHIKSLFTPFIGKILGKGNNQWVKMLTGIPKKLISGAIDKIKDFLTGGGGPVAYKAGGGVRRWTPLVLRALAMLHQPASWLGTVLRRMNQESGGNPSAQNNWDVNARNGVPSQGLMQVIPPTFAAYAGPLRGRGIRDPLANIYAGLNYALHRYGSLAALNRPGGYDTGGDLLPGLTLAYNGTGKPERVLTDQQWNDLTSVRGGQTLNFYSTYEVAGSPEEYAVAMSRRTARAVKGLS